jgi:hypothetical protein
MEPAMRLDFNGSSWAIGVLCAAVYFGHLSPWWLALTPALLFATLLPVHVTFFRT